MLKEGEDYSLCSLLRAADSMHILVVESLLIAIFLSEGRANTYRHRKYDRRIVLPIPSQSAGLA
jgi:hypothetical protein